MSRSTVRPPDAPPDPLDFQDISERIGDPLQVPLCQTGNLVFRSAGHTSKSLERSIRKIDLPVHRTHLPQPQVAPIVCVYETLPFAWFNCGEWRCGPNSCVVPLTSV